MPDSTSICSVNFSTHWYLLVGYLRRKLSKKVSVCRHRLRRCLSSYDVASPPFGEGNESLELERPVCIRIRTTQSPYIVRPAVASSILLILLLVR